MPRSSVRFRPPALVLPPTVPWMLLWAFGPPAAAAQAVTDPPDPPDPIAALELARRFELAPRIAWRQGRRRLEAELGEAAAAGFQRERRRAAATGLRLKEIALEVAAAAAQLDLPLVLLKFAALEAAGLPVAESREACDVDVLAPPELAAELAAALRFRGFRSSRLPAAEHHLPGLEHPAGGAVEVHLLLPGVRLAADGASATVAALAEGGLLAAAPGYPGRCSIPVPPVLAAHALAHGLGQHGFWPYSYSLLKMVGDLVDLAAAAGPAAPELTAAALRLVAEDVGEAEAEAVFRLGAVLASGCGADLLDPTLAVSQEDVDAALLLRHILAGRLDGGYAEALRLGLFRAQPSDRRPARRLAAAVAGTVFLSRAQIDAIYGPPRGRLGYLGRRFARPFDLLARLARYGWRAARLRRRPF
ncbi:MAG TPA: nucleotidyltransferase family protein [Thermoanaerobaculia bacterium]|nr:nucleotidyltransferase family protein [Thermoanaerobaculia bacterium]